MGTWVHRAARPRRPAALGVAALVLVAASCVAAPDPAASWHAVAVELARRVEADQALRAELMSGVPITPELVQRLGATDAANTAWLKDVVARQGWPTIARVGARGASDAWLLVQHADHDVEFQEHCLGLLRAAVADGQADAKNLAYLEDRVAMHRGRPQRYGTQFVPREGRLEPWTLEDPSRVDEWRASVGLGPLAEYAELLGDV